MAVAGEGGRSVNKVLQYPELNCNFSQALRNPGNTVSPEMAPIQYNC